MNCWRCKRFNIFREDFSFPHRFTSTLKSPRHTRVNSAPRKTFDKAHKFAIYFIWEQSITSSFCYSANISKQDSMFVKLQLKKTVVNNTVGGIGGVDITNFWSIVLDDHWSKTIYRPKMIVWSGAIIRPYMILLLWFFHGVKRFMYEI